MIWLEIALIVTGIALLMRLRRDWEREIGVGIINDLHQYGSATPTTVFERIDRQLDGETPSFRAFVRAVNRLRRCGVILVRIGDPIPELGFDCERVLELTQYSKQFLKRK